MVIFLREGRVVSKALNAGDTIKITMRQAFGKRFYHRMRLIRKKSADANKLSA